MREINFLFSTNSIRHTVYIWCCNATLYRLHQGSLQSAKHGGHKWCTKITLQMHPNKIKMHVSRSNMLARTNHFGWWPFIHNVFRHGHVSTHTHCHRQQAHYMKRVTKLYTNYNRTNIIQNTHIKTRTIFIYLETRQRLNLYPNWMFSWLHCHVVSLFLSLITLFALCICVEFHWSCFFFVWLPEKFVQFHLLLLDSMSIIAFPTSCFFS